MTVQIFTAGSGGHLMQLKILAQAGLAGADEIIWVTDRTPQSESLLKGERVVYLPHRAPRDILGVVRNAWAVRRLFTPEVTRVVSTGAGIALSLYLPALFSRRAFRYIESATRASSLSLTGRVFDFMPRVERRVQHQELANRKWKYEGSVFDCLNRSTHVDIERDVKTVFVSLGANQHAGFRPLIDRILTICPPSVDVFFQYGPTDLTGLSINGVPSLSWEEVVSRSRSADVVITHAGTGSILTTLLCGKVPLVVPRSASAGEHVDEHQSDLAKFAELNGYASVAHVDELSWSEVVAAARRVVVVADAQS